MCVLVQLCMQFDKSSTGCGSRRLQLCQFGGTHLVHSSCWVFTLGWTVFTFPALQFSYTAYFTYATHQPKPQSLTTMKQWLHLAPTIPWRVALMLLSAFLCMLSVAADHCMHVFKRSWCSSQVKLIVEKDSLFLTHQMMHNVLFLIRKKYYTLTVADVSIQTPPGYKVTKEYCCPIQTTWGIQ